MRGGKDYPDTGQHNGLARFFRIGPFVLFRDPLIVTGVYGRDLFLFPDTPAGKQA